MIGALDPAVAVAVTVGTESVVDLGVRIAGFALLAGISAVVAAFAFRWVGADELPDGVAVLIGVSTVALWLNTRTALQDAILGDTQLTDPATAVFTLAAFAASAIAADGGRRLGDELARGVVVGAPRTITDVSQLVRAAGRVVAVELPADVDDVDGYDPVDDAVKADLAGETFRFPRRLSVDERRERLIARLERDYGIGHVDVDFEADGSVGYLAVGSRLAGIGPTLAPGTVAVALAGDPATDASPGDAIRIWARDGENGDARRVAQGELRATAGDVVTVAIDAEDAGDFEADREYRLVTLPGSPDAERTLVSLLRAADETVTTVTVGSDDPLAGRRIGALGAFVLAIERENGADQIAIPAGTVRLAPGDVAYVLGRPDALRRVTERLVEPPGGPTPDDGGEPAADREREDGLGPRDEDERGAEGPLER